MIIAGVLLALPSVILSGHVYIGGDSTQLYLVRPEMWFSHISLAGSNYYFSGYEPQQSYWFLTGLLSILHRVDPWTESTVFGAVLAGGFLACAAVTRRVAHMVRIENRTAVSVAGAVAGLIYVLAPVVGQVTWEAIVPGFMWVALLPAVLLAIMHDYESPSWTNVASVAILMLLCAPAAYDAPEAIASVGMVAMATLCFAAVYGWKSCCVRLVRFSSVGVVGSAFWLVPEAASIVLGQGQQGAAISSGTVSSAVGLIRSLQSQLSVAAEWTLRPAPLMERSNDWPQLRFLSWTSGWAFIGVCIALLAVVGVIWMCTRPRGRSQLFGCSWFGLVVIEGIWVSAGVAFGLGGEMRSVFARPVLDSQRNFWVTDLVPFVLVMAITSGCGLAAILARQHVWQRWKVGAIVGVASCLLAAYDAPFVLGDVFREPVYVGATDSAMVASLPGGYVKTIEEIDKLGGGRLLTLPLLTPSWSAMANGGSVYLGSSPLYLLGGLLDFDSPSLFTGMGPAGLAAYVTQQLNVGNVRPLVRAAKAAGVRYIVAPAKQLQPGVYNRVGAVLPERLAYSEVREIVKDGGFHQVIVSGGVRLYERRGSVGVPAFVAADYEGGVVHVARVVTGVGSGSVRPCGSIVRGSGSMSDLRYRMVVRKGRGRCAVQLLADSGPWVATIDQGHGARKAHATAQKGAVSVSLPLQGGVYTITITNGLSAAGYWGFGITAGGLLVSGAVMGMKAWRRRLNERRWRNTSCRIEGG